MDLDPGPALATQRKVLALDWVGFDAGQKFVIIIRSFTIAIDYCQYVWA